MKHYGDITQIKGSEVPMVDIITGGSPCQDLSVAGKRAGLDGERSGLFMEQVRIVKEMRDECVRQLQMRGADDNRGLVRPRYMVWENVPGAFSSNKGKDFQAVLTEICRIVCKDCPDVPLPEKGKWTKSGCLMGYGDDGRPFSIAYRLHDAQFWGVPQRRKRIALVADFGGTSAPEILFESKSLSGDSEPSESQGKATSRTTGESIDPSSYTLKIRGGVERDSSGKRAGKGALVQTELSGTLGVSQDQTLITGVDTYNQNLTGDVTMSLRIKADNEHIPCVVLEGNGSRPSHKGDGYKESDVSYTLNSTEQHAVCVGTAYDGSQVSPTITANNAGGQQRMPDKENFNAVICYGLDRASFNQGKNAQYDFSVDEDLAQPIVARGPGGGVMQRITQ